MTDDFKGGLLELAAKLRRGGVAQNAGTAGFLLRAIEHIENLQERLLAIQRVPEREVNAEKEP